MRAYLHVTGFGFSPDEAITNAVDRAQVDIAKGWKLDSDDIVPVKRGTNPYADTPVHGYIATVELTKEITDDRIPKEPF